MKNNQNPLQLQWILNRKILKLLWLSIFSMIRKNDPKNSNTLKRSAVQTYFPTVALVDDLEYKKSILQKILFTLTEIG